jgi:hypothetical protein
MDSITFNFNMHHLNELDIVFNESIKVSNIKILSEVYTNVCFKKTATTLRLSL